MNGLYAKILIAPFFVLPTQCWSAPASPPSGLAGVVTIAVSGGAGQKPDITGVAWPAAAAGPMKLAEGRDKLSVTPKPVP